MSKKLTPWFPASVKPIRKGIYFAAFRADEGFAYWDGSAWGWLAGTADACLHSNNIYTSTAAQDKEWRGLAEQPK